MTVNVDSKMMKDQIFYLDLLYLTLLTITLFVVISLFLTVQYPQNILSWTKSKRVTLWLHCRISICFCCHLSTADRTQNYISFKNYNIMPEIFNIKYVFKSILLKNRFILLFQIFLPNYKKTPPKPSIYKSTIWNQN